MKGKSATQQKLTQHFGDRPLEQVVTAARTFPLASRVDVQVAIDELFASREKPALLGIHSPFGHETTTLAHLFARGPYPVEFGPLQHDDVDIGDPSLPRRCKRLGAEASALRVRSPQLPELSRSTRVPEMPPLATAQTTSAP